MTAMRYVVATAVVVLLTGQMAASQSGSAALESEAARVLADLQTSFGQRSVLVDQLSRALAAERDAEAAGRLALLWTQALRRTLEAVPFDKGTVPPYSSWLSAHEADVVYNEPGGQWIVSNDVAWRLHDTHRASRASEALAWEIVENGLPGECEGYPPCYLAGFERLHTRYLREYPAGAHAAQAVSEIHESLDQVQRLLARPDGREFFNPATDCKDLIPPADALRTVLEHAKVETTATRRLLKVIRNKC
jgi:hypothetical protein